MQLVYKTKGTCSSSIITEVEDGILTECRFLGGCNGNLQGVTALVIGMPVSEVIQKLEGIRCGVRGTSCPDQLAQALRLHGQK